MKTSFLFYMEKLTLHFMVYNDRKVKVIYISNNVLSQDGRSVTSVTKSNISVRKKFPRDRL